MDFDSPAAAQKAVSALKTTGVQAQMAKVRIHNSLILVCYPYSSVLHISPPSGWSGNKNLLLVVDRTGIPDCSVYAPQ